MLTSKFYSDQAPVNKILRNPLRVINHQNLIKIKLNIGLTWSLIWNSESVNSTEYKVKGIVEALFKKEITIASAINSIKKINYHVINRNLEDDLLKCYNTGLLEFHPTDYCDLKCIDCHYRRKDKRGKLPVFQYNKIEKVIKFLSPKAITVTGGGEPNVYKNNKKNMNDIIILLKTVFPKTRIGIINNNTYIPSGHWVNCVEWQRTSVDAASRETYKKIKRKDKFESSIANVKTLLHNTRIPYVGIGFLYRSENIHEINSFLDYWFDSYYKKVGKSTKHKFNIQFRPISPPINEVIRIRKGEISYIDQRYHCILKTEIEKVIRRAQEEKDYKDYLINRTNFYSIIEYSQSNESPFLHRLKPFSKCYNALIHRVLRSNGDEYPDFLLCDYEAFKLGNTLNNSSIEEKFKISLLQFYFYNKCGDYCCAESCRQGWVSNTLERYFNNDFSNNCLKKVPLNYFF